MLVPKRNRETAFVLLQRATCENRMLPVFDASAAHRRRTALRRSAACVFARKSGLKPGEIVLVLECSNTRLHQIASRSHALRRRRKHLTDAAFDHIESMRDVRGSSAPLSKQYRITPHLVKRIQEDSRYPHLRRAPALLMPPPYIAHGPQKRAAPVARSEALLIVALHAATFCLAENGSLTCARLTQ